MAREREERVVDHSEQYTGEVFESLAAAWNDKISRERPGENIEMIGAPPAELNDPAAHIIQAVFAKDTGMPFKLLCPVLIGGNHWVGVVVEKDDTGKFTIVVNDPLRTGSPELKEILDTLGESFGVSCSYDPKALKQEDYVSCGPYVFENMTSYVTGVRRPDIKRMTLRTEQLEMIKDSAYVKQISFSKEVDNALIALSKDVGGLDSNEAVFNKIRSKLTLDLALRKEYGDIFSRFNSTSDHQGQLLKRIRFHAEHDEHGLHKDVLLREISGPAELATELGPEVAGVYEVIEKLHTNQDVDKLPPAVFTLLTNPRNYNADLLGRIEAAYKTTGRVRAAAAGGVAVAEFVPLGTPVGGAMTSPRAESRASSGGGSPGGGGGGGPSPVSWMSPSVEVEGCMNALAIGLMAKHENTNSVIQAIARDLDSGMVIEDIVAKTKIPTLTKQVELFAKFYSNPDNKPLIDSLLVIGEEVKSAEPTVTPAHMGKRLVRGL